MEPANTFPIEGRKTLGGKVVGFAVAYFAGLGYHVSLPVFDDAAYDLIAERNGRLLRVQCKSALVRKSRYHEVALSQRQGNRPRYAPSDFDLLWVASGRGFYLIPMTDLLRDGRVRAQVRLSPAWERFRVADFWPHGDDDATYHRRRASRLSASERRRIVYRYSELRETASAIAADMGLALGTVTAALHAEGAKREGRGKPALSKELQAAD